mgnify:CR=1 FL=1
MSVIGGKFQYTYNTPDDAGAERYATSEDDVNDTTHNNICD